MIYTIIEDASPYYIRFTHEGIDNIIKQAESFCLSDYNIDASYGFLHHRLPNESAKSILSHVPMTAQLPEFNDDRVSLFVSTPGMYYRAHKDGLDHRFSINYTVRILDDKCVTSWYSDHDLRHYAIDNLKTNISRECVGFKKENHIPLKSMVARPGECILFNTEIFHDWDNRQSTNYRIVLTLRLKQPYCSSLYFEDIRQTLFGY